MDEKKYITNSLYVGVISRQTSKQRGAWGLINKKYCILIKESDVRYRCVLSDSIYSISSENTSNRDVVNAKTIVPLTELFPNFKEEEFITRSTIYDLEHIKLTELFALTNRYDELKIDYDLCK